MAQRQVTVGVAANLTAILTLSATGLPATGLTAAALTCEYRKEGGAFVAKVLTGLVTELGHGLYSIAFTSAELNTLGEFVFVLNSATTTQFAGEVSVVAATVTPTAVQLLTCTLTDYVFDPAGNPVAGASVIARTAGQPTLQGSVGVTNAAVSVQTGADGQFFLPLPRLAMFDVTIPATGWQSRISVPNASTASLYDQGA